MTSIAVTRRVLVNKGEEGEVEGTHGLQMLDGSPLARLPTIPRFKLDSLYSNLSHGRRDHQNDDMYMCKLPQRDVEGLPRGRRFDEGPKSAKEGRSQLCILPVRVFLTIVYISRETFKTTVFQIIVQTSMELFVMETF